VVAALAGLDHGEAQVEEATHRVSVAVEAGTDRLRDALRSLDTAGVAVDDLSLRRPTLDEVFLALTGQALDGESHDDAAHPAA
jgi:ABC-2 type transport system ATP-binding protein